MYRIPKSDIALLWILPTYVGPLPFREPMSTEGQYLTSANSPLIYALSES